MTNAPEVVYHYTDQIGLLGILQKNELWCSHVAYLNDASEYEFATNTYIDLLKSLIDNCAEDEQLRGFARQALHYLYPKHLGRPEPRAHVTRHFVGSFSEAEDDLPQWRGYSETGSRFNIGFRAEALSELASANKGRFDRVHYGADMLQYVRTTFVDNVKSLERELLGHRGIPVDGPPMWYVQLNNAVFASIGTSCKHDAFESEKEWRLSFRGNNVNFRPGRSLIIPYGVLDLSKAPQPIASITVGPGPHKDLSRQSLEWMFRNTGARIAVKESRIPYRDW